MATGQPGDQLAMPSALPQFGDVGGLNAGFRPKFRTDHHRLLNAYASCVPGFRPALSTRTSGDLRAERGLGQPQVYPEPRGRSHTAAPCRMVVARYPRCRLIPEYGCDKVAMPLHKTDCKGLLMSPQARSVPWTSLGHLEESVDEADSLERRAIRYSPGVNTHNLRRK